MIQVSGIIRLDVFDGANGATSTTTNSAAFRFQNTKTRAPGAVWVSIIEAHYVTSSDQQLYTSC